MRPNIENFIGCDSSYRAASIVLYGALFKLIADLGVKNGWLLWPLRTAISGKQFTPGGAVELCDILGKQDSLARIRKGIEKLS